MRRLLFICLLAGGMMLLAKENHTFGPVPPPSSFPELTQVQSNTVPAPSLMPVSRLNSLVPMPGRSPFPVLRQYPASDLETAPKKAAPPAKPKPEPALVLKPIPPKPAVVVAKPKPAPEPTPAKSPPPKPAPEIVAKPKPAPSQRKVEPKPIREAASQSKPAPKQDDIPKRPAPLPRNTAGASLLTTPGGGLDGRLVLVDDLGRYVLVNFPLGQMPATNQTLVVTRHGVKVGEVLVTGPQRDDSIVADVVSGEFRIGDEARSR